MAMITTVEARTASRAAGKRNETARHGCRVDFLRPRSSALARIKGEVVHLGNDGTREGFKFAEKLFRALPELRNE
jgi:hypothetical protein